MVGIKELTFVVLLSSLCFAQLFSAPTISVTSPFIEIPEWDFLGPFQVGKVERDGDPIEAYGGIRNIPRGPNTDKYYSELVDGGEVGWTTLRADRSGEIPVSFQNLDWNKLYSTLTDIKVIEFQGWAIGDFDIEQEGPYVIHCPGIHTIELDDDRLLHGDIYNSDLKSAVKLERGTHTLWLRIRARGSTSFRCRITSGGHQYLTVNKFLPDILEGKLINNLLSVSVHNYRTTWLRHVAFKTTTPGVTITNYQIFDVAPGQALSGKVYFEISTPPTSGSEENCFSFVLIGFSENDKNFQNEQMVTLRCRTWDQSFLFTFVDHDGTVTAAAAIRPRTTCQEGGCPVLLSLSGVGVTPQNHADSHKYMLKGKKTYTFGFTNAWVLAPERGGAHNWEGTGHLTAFASLPALQQVMANTQYQPNINWLIYAGHSRGGHGAMLLASNAPDRATAVVAASGWLVRETYGDANPTFGRDISMDHLDPHLQGILSASIMEHQGGQSCSNLKGLAVLVRTSGEDRTVPPYFMRRYARLLKEHLVDVVFDEVAGHDHWWWDTTQPNDGGVMFDPTMRKFYTTHFLKPPAQAPPDYTLNLYNPATSYGRGGVRVLQLTTPFRKATVRVHRTDSHYHLTTTNVRRLSFFVQSLNPDTPPPSTLILDNTPFDLPPEKNFSENFFRNSDGTWDRKNDFPEFEWREKGPGNYGPIRQTFARPFAVVYGTVGSATEMQRDLDFAVFFANSHFVAQGTEVPILADVDVEDSLAAGYNLVLIGTHTTNLQISKRSNTFPINITTPETISLTPTCKFQGPGYGTVFLAPDRIPEIPENPKTGTPRLLLVVTGTDKKGIRDIINQSFSSRQALTRAAFSNMVPDFMVTGPEYGWKGYGGLVGAGFFGNLWEVNRDTSYLCC